MGIYNWCIIGCHAANRGNRHCKRKCRYADIPTRLTRPACIHGCTKYHEENKICGDHIHVDPNIAASHERILEEARLEKQKEDEAMMWNDHHAKLNEETDKSYSAKRIAKMQTNKRRR